MSQNLRVVGVAGPHRARFGVAGWVVQALCSRCETWGQLESDGWFRCPLNHQWQVPCFKCSSPIVVLPAGLVCQKRRHEQPY